MRKNNVNLEDESSWIEKRLTKLRAERDEYGEFPEAAHDDQDRQAVDRIIEALERRQNELSGNLKTP